jgi:hypothetical protein
VEKTVGCQQVDLREGPVPADALPPRKFNAHFKFIDRTGQEFERLRVVYYVGRKGIRTLWLCKCRCGNYTVVSSDNLAQRRTRSCGCLLNEVSAAGIARRHGGSKTPLYVSWTNMLQNYRRRVCGRWKGPDGFVNFSTDMGKRPAGMVLGRKDYTLGWTPENCAWVTKKKSMESSRRTRLLTFEGKTLNMSDWAEEKGLLRETLRLRLKAGWTLAEALTRPADKGARRAKK